eukprot:8545638-Prorocentrum_lima.AAC.1
MTSRWSLPTVSVSGVATSPAGTSQGLSSSASGYSACSCSRVSSVRGAGGVAANEAIARLSSPAAAR